MTDRREWFAELRENQATYRTTEAYRRLLAEKSFVAIVGAGAIGKSTIMNRVVELDERFTRVSGFTSRGQRPNDEPGMYRYIRTDADYQQLADEINQHVPVQYAVHPVKDSIYGTHIGDYVGEYTMKDVWYNAIPDFAKLDFKRSTTIALVSNPDVWNQWFTIRFPREDPEALPRIIEAQQSLLWMIENQSSISWLDNRAGETDAVARKFISISTGEDSSLDGSKLATGMLEAAKALEKSYS